MKTYFYETSEFNHKHRFIIYGGTYINAGTIVANGGSGGVGGGHGGGAGGAGSTTIRRVHI
jgi:hypothetical protein